MQLRFSTTPQFSLFDYTFGSIAAQHPLSTFPIPSFFQSSRPCFSTHSGTCNGIALTIGSHMMTAAAVIGLSAGKRLLSSSYYYSDHTEKLSCSSQYGSPHCQAISRNVIRSKKSSYNDTSFLSNRQLQSIKALKEHVATASEASSAETFFQRMDNLRKDIGDPEYSLEALLLLQKSMLEKQWNLSREGCVLETTRERTSRKGQITSSGTYARQRRAIVRRKKQNSSIMQPSVNQLRSDIDPELLKKRLKGYVKGVISEELLTHPEVVQLSKIIKIEIYLEQQKLRLKERLGCEPSEEQLATSLMISRAELQSKWIECSLAREKLAMSNIRLVISIAKKYDNMGAEMDDLVQGGLVGLLRGIEKFDASKGFKISTYVYWWIRQGVSRVLVENSRTLRLPTYLYERIGLIRSAKTKLTEKGIVPSIDEIAAYLNMSQKKVRNATEASSKLLSLDRQAFPSINGLRGETLHSYIADNQPDNIPWNRIDKWALKDEVEKLINTTLREREREIIRLYFGLDNKCLTWEDISKRIGLSRERVRQVGLVALEKLKHAARRKKMEAMLLKH
ncbi:RNA polymerase sigma factor sigA-like [Impatiens glandulifera]|uniref:RNA polymerase sigma factor sigA-like n=1 Tax=Impatiens glandulifera TaxID=253017 RepID=UPI001FB099DF|nr:RNA polymerase sigma factor sigA-like [Impatiens glandulifera]